MHYNHTFAYMVHPVALAKVICNIANLSDQSSVLYKQHLTQLINFLLLDTLFALFPELLLLSMFLLFHWMLF